MNKGLIAIGTMLLLLSLALSINAKAVTLSGDFSDEAFQQQTIVKEYELCNTDNIARALQLKAIGEKSSWFSIGQASTPFNALECREVFAFITPHPYAFSGNYDIQLVINNENTYSNFFNLEVLQGHTASLNISPNNQTVSQCQQANYSLSIRNTGRFNETIQLQSLGIPSTWVNFSQESFYLVKGTSKTIDLTIQAPCNQELRNYSFEVKLLLENSNYSITRNAEIEIENDQEIQININSTIEACLDAQTSNNIEIRNTGKFSDTIELELLNSPDWIELSTKTLEIEAGKRKTIDLIARKNSEEPQTFNPIIKISSSKFNTNYQKTLTIDLGDCFNLSIEKVSGTEEACIEEQLEWKFELTNTGRQSTNYELSSFGLNSTLDKESISLSPGQTETIKAIFDLSNETIAQKTFTITADSENFSSRKSHQLNLLNCYDAKIKLPELKLCKGVSETTKFTIENSGVRNQTYEISIEPEWIESQASSISINAGETKEIDLLIKTPAENIPKTFKIITSTDKISQEIEKEISIKSENECFGLSISTDSIDVNVSLTEGKRINVKISNNGVESQTVNVFASNEPWIFFNPKTLTIPAGETKEAFVYFAPPIDFELDKKTIQIRAKNAQGIQSVLSLNLSFSDGKRVVSIPENFVKIINVSGKQALIEFSIRNDSDSNLAINEISSPDFVAEFNFQKRSIPSTTMETIQMTLSLDSDDSNLIVPLTVLTNQGKFNKFLKIGLPEQVIPTSTGFNVLENPIWSGLFILAIVAVLFVGYLVNRKYFAEEQLNQPIEPTQKPIASQKLKSTIHDIKKQVTAKPRRKLQKKNKTVKPRTANRTFKKSKKPIRRSFKKKKKTN